MRSGAAQTAVPAISGSKRKGDGVIGAPTCSGVASASWKPTRIGLSREIVSLVNAAIAAFSTSLSSARSFGGLARAQLEEQPATDTAASSAPRNPASAQGRCGFISISCPKPECRLAASPAAHCSGA